ncbi:uncharacterized protein LOC125896159 [Epinephelus fuscoguttatus]|uniref:uncharacterized protein LOC125896159 n=1 Tax=Epinephelus fuscoguttatus TaxID=293821 RepID=UPI0020D18502|nr:uncharacterized protein LOC125896159 [Epinephelus fuscoguttatus]
MLLKMCKEAGTTAIYTNHSLRVTAIQKLSDAGLEAREIMTLAALKLDPDLNSNPAFRPSAPPPYNSTTPNKRRWLLERDGLLLTSQTNLWGQKKQVKSALQPPASTSLHDFQPGNWVVIKDLRRKHWHSKCWRGPFQVFLTTHTAVKIAERAMWIHASHFRKIPEPMEELSCRRKDKQRKDGQCEDGQCEDGQREDGQREDGQAQQRTA